MSSYVHRWPVVAAFLAIAGVLASLFVIGTKEPKKPAEVAGVFLDADVGIDRFSFIQTKDGETQWEVRAKRAQILERESKAFLEDLQVTLFEDGDARMVLEGDEGVVDTESNNLTLKKNVGTIPIALKGGYTIHTKDLKWIDRDREISTNSSVTIQGEGIEITGVGLRGALGTEIFTIISDVRAVVTN